MTKVAEKDQQALDVNFSEPTNGPDRKGLRTPLRPPTKGSDQLHMGHNRGGRPKGTPNRLTRMLKEAILLGGEKAGGKDGLVGYFYNVAKNHPDTYCKLAAKILPLQANVVLENESPSPEQRPQERPESDRLITREDVIASLQARGIGITAINLNPNEFSSDRKRATIGKREEK